MGLGRLAFLRRHGLTRLQELEPGQVASHRRSIGQARRLGCSEDHQCNDYEIQEVAEDRHDVQNDEFYDGMVVKQVVEVVDPDDAHGHPACSPHQNADDQKRNQHAVGVLLECHFPHDSQKLAQRYRHHRRDDKHANAEQQAGDTEDYLSCEGVSLLSAERKSKQHPGHQDEQSDRFLNSAEYPLCFVVRSLRVNHTLQLKCHFVEHCSEKPDREKETRQLETVGEFEGNVPRIPMLHVEDGEKGEKAHYCEDAVEDHSDCYYYWHVADGALAPTALTHQDDKDEEEDADLNAFAHQSDDNGCCLDRNEGIELLACPILFGDDPLLRRWTVLLSAI